MPKVSRYNKYENFQSPCASCVFLAECRETVIAMLPPFCEINSKHYNEYLSMYGLSFPKWAEWPIWTLLQDNSVPIDWSAAHE